MNEEFVATPVGTARITWYQALGSGQALALLGHGSVTGIESADLQALADARPRRDITFGTPGSVTRSTSMTLITAAVTEWIDRRLSAPRFHHQR